MAIIAESPLNEHTTCTLYSTCVPIHSFIKAVIIPDPGYTIYGFKIGNTFPYYYKSSEEENTYYILLNETNNFLVILTSDFKDYSIRMSKSNCNDIDIVVDGYIQNYGYKKFRSGEKINIHCTPDRGYYADTSCIKITKQNSTDSQNDEVLIFPEERSGYFYFIMPNDDININVVCKTAVTVDNESYSFKLGDTYKINLVNHSPNSKFNLYLKEGYKYLPESINIGYYESLTDSYTINSTRFDEESETGDFILNIFPYDYSNKLILSVNLNINLPDTPEGWSTIGVKNSYSTFDGINYSYFYLSKPVSGRLKVKYKFTKNNSPDIYEGEKVCDYSDYNQSIYFYDSGLSSLRNTYDKFYIWIEDDDKKLISRKIVVNTN